MSKKPLTLDNLGSIKKEPRDVNTQQPRRKAGRVRERTAFHQLNNNIDYQFDDMLSNLCNELQLSVRDASEMSLDMLVLDEVDFEKVIKERERIVASGNGQVVQYNSRIESGKHDKAIDFCQKYATTKRVALEVAIYLLHKRVFS